MTAAVPLTHRNLTRTMKNIVDTYKLTPKDRSYLVMPLFHVHGLLAGFLAPLLSGGTVIIPPKFSAMTFWPEFTKYKATWYTAGLFLSPNTCPSLSFQLPPFVLSQFANLNLSLSTPPFPHPFHPSPTSCVEIQSLRSIKSFYATHHPPPSPKSGSSAPVPPHSPPQPSTPSKNHFKPRFSKPTP